MRVSRCGMTRRREDAPKYEVGVSHEIRYAFEHTPWLEDERWKGDLREVHADSAEWGFWSQRVGWGQSVAVRSEGGAHLSWEIRDKIIEPSSSSL